MGGDRSDRRAAFAHEEEPCLVYCLLGMSK